MCKILKHINYLESNSIYVNTIRVKTYVGILQNEIVDNLAKTTASEWFIQENKSQRRMFWLQLNTTSLKESGIFIAKWYTATN